MPNILGAYRALGLKEIEGLEDMGEDNLVSLIMEDANRQSAESLERYEKAEKEAAEELEKAEREFFSIIGKKQEKAQTAEEIRAHLNERFGKGKHGQEK